MGFFTVRDLALQFSSNRLMWGERKQEEGSSGVDKKNQQKTAWNEHLVEGCNHDFVRKVSCVFKRDSVVHRLMR